MDIARCATLHGPASLLIPHSPPFSTASHYIHNRNLQRRTAHKPKEASMGEGRKYPVFSMIGKVASFQSPRQLEKADAGEFSELGGQKELPFSRAQNSRGAWMPKSLWVPSFLGTPFMSEEPSRRGYGEGQRRRRDGRGWDVLSRATHARGILICSAKRFGRRWAIEHRQSLPVSLLDIGHVAP